MQLPFSLLLFCSVFRSPPAPLSRNPGSNQAVCRSLLRLIGMEGEVLLFLLGIARTLGVAVVDFQPVGGLSAG